MFLAYLKVPIDPDQYYFWHSTQTQSNIGNYNNVKVDKLLEDGRSTVDIEEREKIYITIPWFNPILEYEFIKLINYIRNNEQAECQRVEDK